MNDDSSCFFLAGACLHIVLELSKIGLFLVPRFLSSISNSAATPANLAAARMEVSFIIAPLWTIDGAIQNRESKSSPIFRR